MAKTPGPYGLLARFVLAHRPAVAVVLVVVVVVSIVLGIPPRVNPDLLSLLPPDQPTVQALTKLNESEGGVSLITLAFDADDPEQLGPWLDAVTADLQALDRVEYAIHEVDPELTRQLGLLQLEAGELAELNVRLKGALALGPALNPFVTQRLMAMGPLTERIQQLADAPDLLAGSDGTGRILVRPDGSANDQPFAIAVMDDVDGVLAAHAQPGIRTAWIGGAYRHNVEDFRGIQSDLLWTSFTSLALVLAVIVLAFRSWRGTVLVFVPLLSANAIVLALVWLTMDSLNTYTSFGTAVLIGLGIDFAVHLVGRYREYRAAGLDLQPAIERAWDRTGPPCMTAALTSAAGFLALAAAEFQGFAQLGYLLAMGLMICLLMMLVVLPLLIPIFDASPPQPLGVASDSGKPSRSTYRLAPAALSIAVIITGVVGMRTIPKLEWEYDFSELRRDGLSYAQLSETERALARDSYTPMIVDLPSADALAKTQARVQAAVDAGKLPHIGRVISIRSVLPDDQDARVAQLRELVTQIDHPNLRYLPRPLTEKLLPLKGQAIEPHTVDDLPLPVRDLLGARRPDQHRLLLVPTGNMWDLREAAALEAEVDTVLEPGTVAGNYVTMGSLYRVINRDMPLVGGLAILMVFVLTAIDLRRAHWVFAAMGTLLAGLVWASWAVHSVGVKLSIMNIVGVPILVGIGVDVVIHLLHRLRDEGPGGVRRALRTTGVAASLSTLTTVASFASLTVAGNRGVRSMGLLVVFGLIAVFTASAILLPLAWAAGWRVTGRAPGSTGTPGPAPRRRSFPSLEEETEELDDSQDDELL
ncbi:MAG: efflux RND transporter permease subunit [Myxococcota bacterium]